MSEQSTPSSPQNTRTVELRDPGWQSHLARPVLIAIQVTCLMYGLVLIAQIITENPLLRYTPALSFVAALIGVYSAQWLAQPGQRLTNKPAFMLAQLVVIWLILRVLTWGLAQDWPTPADLRLWLVSPESFFDGFFAITAVICALAWHRGHIIGDIFYWLALTPGELAVVAERRSPSWRFDRATDRVLISRQDLVEAYASQWIVGALFIALFAAATRVRLTRGAGLSLLATGIAPQIIVACVFYFLIGLVLVSQARLASLRAQWLQDGVEMPEGLPGRWQRTSLAIILAVGLLATLLPIGSTWQIGEILGVIVGFLAQAVLFVFFLINMLFALIMSLFGSNQPLPELPPPPSTGAAAVPPPILSIPEWLGGAGLWIFVIAVVVLSLRFLLGKEGIDLTSRTLRRAMARLRSLLSAWWDSLRRLAQAVQSGLPAVFRGQGETPVVQARPWRFIRLSALSPRDKVRYFYLSTVRRAAEQGVARQPYQTPNEFVQDLRSAWPEAEGEIDALTQAFVTARYDRVEIAPQDAQTAKSVWERLKQALRSRKPA